MSMLGWWMVHTMVLPVLTMLRTVLMTMAAALASNPEQQTANMDEISQFGKAIKQRCLLYCTDMPVVTLCSSLVLTF